jgi:hypothetical protein
VPVIRIGISDRVWGVDGIIDEYTGNRRASESRFFDRKNRRNSFDLLFVSRFSPTASRLPEALPDCQGDAPERIFLVPRFCSRLDLVLGWFHRNHQWALVLTLTIVCILEPIGWTTTVFTLNLTFRRLL